MKKREIPNPTARVITTPYPWEKLKVYFPGEGTGSNGSGTPIGNGFFGMRHLGRVRKDVWQLSHKAFWSGDPAYLEELRQGGGESFGSTPVERAEAAKKQTEWLLRAYRKGIGKEERLECFRKAEEYAVKGWCTNYQATFLPLGEMTAEFADLDGEPREYTRSLSLDTAVGRTEFSMNGVKHVRECFASHPDHVCAVKLAAEGKPLNVRFGLTLPAPMVGKLPENRVFVDPKHGELCMTGRAPIEKCRNEGTWHEGRGIFFSLRVRPVVREGVILWERDGFTVKDAEEIVLLEACETTFRDAFTDPANSGIDADALVREAVDKAVSLGWDALLSRHCEDYRTLFRRLWIEMDGEKILLGNGYEASPADFALRYQFSRYITIADSREDSPAVPMTLFGMWNGNWMPENESCYFLNESVQKMHRTFGPANLADLGETLTEWVEVLADERRGGAVSSDTRGIPGGWMVRHSTDVWGIADLYGEESRWANWDHGGIWLLNEVYGYTLYSRDPEHLKRVYPLLEGAARFVLGTLTHVQGVRGELTPYLVQVPSASPEHWYLTEKGEYLGGTDINTACDRILNENLFRMLLEAAERLKKLGESVNEELTGRVKEALAQLMPMEMFIDSETGLLREYYNGYPLGESFHRHASNLLGSYVDHVPRSETVRGAEKKEFVRRADGKAGYLPGATLPEVVTMGVRMDMQDWIISRRAGMWPYVGYVQPGAHWPVGHSPSGTGFIADALVGCEEGELRLLPHLPAAWSRGTVEGMVGPDGSRISFTWENGQVIQKSIEKPDRA